MSTNERVNWLTQTLDRNLSAGVEGDLVGVTKVDLAYAIAYVHELEQKLESQQRQTARDAWERGMADAKLQSLGIRTLVRNPYLERTEL